jgi:hypothetical protein
LFEWCRKGGVRLSSPFYVFILLPHVSPLG